MSNSPLNNCSDSYSHQWHVFQIHPWLCLCFRSASQWWNILMAPWTPWLHTCPHWWVECHYVQTSLTDSQYWLLLLSVIFFNNTNHIWFFWININIEYTNFNLFVLNKLITNCSFSFKIIRVLFLNVLPFI